MKPLRFTLPPLTSLVIFEASARLGSFTLAASELRISREAVSRQIRTLEEFLEVQLFERRAKAVQLTPCGAHYLDVVGANLGAIAQAKDILNGNVVPGQPELPATSGAAVLIVDDVAENIGLLRHMLSDDYGVLVEKSGRDALIRANLSLDFDIVLLDVKIAEREGYELCRFMKAGAHTRNIPFIILSSCSSADDEARSLEMGAVDYILRSTDAKVLIRRIERQIDLCRKKAQLEHLVISKNKSLEKVKKIINGTAKYLSAIEG